MRNISKLILLIILTITGCTSKQSFQEEIIINDCFLDVVGSQGYYGSSLIPPPPRGDEKNNNTYEFLVEIDTVMKPLKLWKKSIDIFLNKDTSFSEYKSFINEHFTNNDDARNLSVNEINRTGRYELINVREHNPKVIGKVEFSRVAYNKEINKGAFVVTISAGTKAGLEKFILVKKKKGVWKVTREEIFMIW